MTDKKVGFDLTTSPILKTLLLFSAPMMLTNIIQQIYSMVDLLVIGKFAGPIGTVGVSTGGEVADYMAALAVVLASAGQVIIAQYIGAGKREYTEKIIGTIFTMMITFSIVIMAAILILCSNILTWLKCPEQACSEAGNYMMITAIGMPFIFGYNTVSSILRGMGESRMPLVFVIIAAVLNVFFDLILVIAFNMGAAGTAIATVVSQFGAFAASLIYMFIKRESIGFSFRPSAFIPDGRIAGKFAVQAFPLIVRITAVRFSMMWVTAQVNVYGVIASGTSSIGGKIQKFMENLMFGAETAASAMVGQNLGAKQPERARKSVWCALGISGVVWAISFELFFLIPKPLYSIFTSDADIIEFGVIYMHIMVVSVFCNGMTGTLQAVVTGSGNAPLNFVMGIVDGITRVLFSLLFFYVFDCGVVSFFWGTALSRSVNGIITFVYFLSRRWERRKLLTE